MVVTDMAFPGRAGLAALAFPGRCFLEALPKVNTGKIANCVRGKNQTLNGISATSRDGGGEPLNIAEQLLRVDWEETGLKLAAYQPSAPAIFPGAPEETLH